MRPIDNTPKFCPHCGEKNTLSESAEPFTDYYVVGQTFRCSKCHKGFGFLLDIDD